MASWNRFDLGTELRMGVKCAMVMVVEKMNIQWTLEPRWKTCVLTMRSSAQETTNPRQRYRFLKSEDVQKRLKSQNEDALIEALTTFRNQITVRHDEGIIPAGDERLLLVKSWLDISPGAQELFDIWERTTTRQLSLLSLVISTLSAILSLTSSHYSYHSTAVPIAKALLTSQWSSKLNVYLSMSHNELLLVTLKLYYVLSSFAGGSERRSVLEVFPWDAKSLPRLLTYEASEKKITMKPMLLRDQVDIRTLYVLLILSFVDETASSSVKSIFLEQRREILLSILKGLNQDSYSLMRRVLETCWAGIWSDQRIKRTLKYGLFNETTLSQILRLYDRSSPEGPTLEDIPADVAHHFMLAICTRPGTGICFKDSGWYPREEIDDEAQMGAQSAAPSRASGRVHNKILASVLRTLKVNEDSRQQELAHRILQACPELVAGYWPAASLTLEPRLSSRWITNISFFGSVISLPVPEASFFISGSDLYRPSPPPLVPIVENILPAVNIRSHLSRGLQSTSPLVQHCTAIALAKCLMKYGTVLQSIDRARQALEENEEGHWTRRRHELEREVARRVPEFQVVVAFAQQTSSDAHSVSEHATVQPVQEALLAESAQRLLWLYHQWLPSLVAEARFDVGKLLQRIQDGSRDSSAGISGLAKMLQLHVLRLLRESDQFTLFGKTGSSRGAFSILMKLYVASGERAVRPVVSALLRRTLSSTVLFQHDIEELELWLSALPFNSRNSNTEAPDGTLLTSEEDAVINFLEDCAQRCTKTPYRYLESLEKCWSRGAGDEALGSMADSAESFPSPLLMTVLEQLEAKLRGSLVTPSDALSLFSFVRRLLWALAQKAQDIQLLNASIDAVESLLPFSSGFGELIGMAIGREVRLLRDGLRELACPSEAMVDEVNPVVEEFLRRAEEVPLPENPMDRVSSACELVDWVRLTDPKLSVEQLGRLVDAISRLDLIQARQLFDYLFPSGRLLYTWLTTGPKLNGEELWFEFPLLFMHSGDAALADERCRDLLSESFVRAADATPTSLQRLFTLVNARLKSSEMHPARRADLLLLLHSIAVKLIKTRSHDCENILLSILRLEGIRMVTHDTLPNAALHALDILLHAIDSVDGVQCRHMLSSLANPWIALLEGDMDSLSPDQFNTASVWIRFADVSGLTMLLRHVCDVTHSSSNRRATIVERLVFALDRTAQHSQSSFLAEMVPELLLLQTVLTDSPALEKLVDLALSECIPPFTDGRVNHAHVKRDIAEVFGNTRPQSGRFLKVPEVDIQAFLDKPTWTVHTASIVAHLTYLQSGASSAVAHWLQTCKPDAGRLPHIAQIVHAFLDSNRTEIEIADVSAQLGNLFSQFLQDLLDESLPSEHASAYLDCIALVPRLPLATSQQVVASMCITLRAQGHTRSNRHLLSVARNLCTHAPSLACGLIDDLFDNSLQWVLTLLSNSAEASNIDNTMIALASVLRTVDSVQAHRVEPLLITILQHHLGERVAVLLARELVVHTALKPASANRYIQAIIQHPKLYSMCSATSGARDEIVALLHYLFNMHPSNSCQPSHVEPLLQLYGGTLSPSDRQILSIFSLFERIRKTSVAALLAQWSPSVGASSDGALSILHNLDPTSIWRTCLYFPQWSPSADGSLSEDKDIYDPFFVMLICSRMLSEDLPTSASGWVQLFRTNVVSLLIRALSSHRGSIRQLALQQVSALYQTLQDVDMQEKPHVIYILSLLKDLYPINSAEVYPPRPPVYTTLYLAHALRGVFYPSHFTYPLTSRFLLQRPELDTSDVPLLYSMLYSTSDQYRRERTWMVRFLSQGMVGRAEWRVLRRRHTWDLLASMFSAEQGDHGLRRSVLEFLANITCNQYATTSLVLGSSLLSWIELQLPSMHAEEGLAWAKILENIVVAVDSHKIESATNGEWRSALGRCLRGILKHSEACTQAVLIYVMRVLSRLRSLSSGLIPHGDTLVGESMIYLGKMETSMRFEDLMQNAHQDTEEHLAVDPPHAARRLWESKETAIWRVWGLCVEALWSVTMASESRHPDWFTLTQRMLLWRAVSRDGTSISEWARREVVANIG
ncbi:hypothetical protein NM688_g3084 [Phlebia brevispora]|uniref:Uncharacterized protein n=1 Tax=Phlebia brevispora TaxID=194682 RepID=A0ACC1T6X6_9APHY|nr:hypothetical protein NM688_g3084 [Phlebia brevispora]